MNISHWILYFFLPFSSTHSIRFIQTGIHISISFLLRFILFSFFHFHLFLFFFFITDDHMKNRFTDRYAFGSERPRLRNECYGATSAHPPRNKKPSTTYNETIRLLRTRKERRGAPCPRKIPFHL